MFRLLDFRLKVLLKVNSMSFILEVRNRIFYWGTSFVGLELKVELAADKMIVCVAFCIGIIWCTFFRSVIWESTLLHVSVLRKGAFKLFKKRIWCRALVLYRIPEVVGDHSWGWPEGSLFNSYYTEVSGTGLLLSLDCSTLPLPYNAEC